VQGNLVKEDTNMTKKKNYYYVGVVMHDGQCRFVTSVDSESRSCEWVATDKPYAFYSLDDAQYVSLGLMCHGTTAYPIHLNYEITEPLYRKVDDGKEA
jgi:hypothetical protein